MEQNNRPHIKTEIRREIAGYDSNGNPIYREVRVAVRQPAVQAGRRTAPKNAQVVRRVSSPSAKKRKKKKQNAIKRFAPLIVCFAIIIAAVIGVVAVYKNSLAYKDSLETALSVTSDSILDTFKVDSDKRIAVYKNSGKLCATLVKTKGSNDETSYKVLKSCSTLDISTYAADRKGKSMSYSKSGGVCFALDYSSSEQYGEFADYIKENAEKSFKPGAIAVDEDPNTIFVLWYWTE